MTEETFEELPTEEEHDEIPYVEYDISNSPSDPTLELLVDQLKREDIIIPFYQRKYVWKIQQASKLIESFLMGLPVPQVFFYVNSEDQLEVIDGHQRLMSIKYFLDGYFGEPDRQGKRKVFKLRGLAERSEYNGKSYVELTSRDQRKLRNSTLRAINIKQLKPTSDGDSVFHIFERLNTGGTQLKPQEIRNAVYRGEIVRHLKELNRNHNWLSILRLSYPDKNQKDVELVLRLFSLFKKWDAYEKPMLRHLNTFMRANRDFDSALAGEFEQRFPAATKIVNNAIDDPFRPRGVLNSAVLEAVMITVLEGEDINEEQLKRTYPILIEDEEFQDSTSGATTDTAVLHKRIKRAKQIIENGS